MRNLCLFLFWTSVALCNTEKYNVLFIAIDDMRPELNYLGADYAKTPHMDKLSQEGAVFENHYVQVATCGSSRYALLTGRSPFYSGAYSNGCMTSGKTALSQEKGATAQSLPELFRRNGYKSICIGKISHSPDGRLFAYNGKGDGRMEMPNAWDELPTPFGPWKRGWGTFFAYANGKHREDGSGHKDLMEFKATEDHDLPDGLMADTAIKRLEKLKQSGERFFMGLGFYKPHLPFVAPKQDWDAFEDVTISKPDTKKPTAYTHKSGEFYKYDMSFKKSYPLSDSATLQSRRAYLACVRYVDRQLGKVMTALDKLGLRETTIVVVWGDHGWHLGEQQQWAKHTPFERAMRSLLIIDAPGQKVNGRQKALVETIDLFPTLVELADLKIQDTRHRLDGKSMVPVLNGLKSAHRESAISYWKDAISIRDQQYRLIYSQKKKKVIALYDKSKSLDSVEDLSQSKPEIVKRLMKSIPK